MPPDFWRGVLHPPPPSVPCGLCAVLCALDLAILQIYQITNNFFQCFGSGSGSGRIRIIWSDPDPDPYQETLIWIRVAPKINQTHGFYMLYVDL